MRRKNCQILAIAVIALMMAATAPAATINLTVHNSSWLGNVWGGAAPIAGNDYNMVVVGTNNPTVLRTSTAAGGSDVSTSFPGNSITVPNQCRFLMKQSAPNTATINGGNGNIIVQGGSRLSAGANGTGNGGAITLDVGQLIVSANTTPATLECNDASSFLYVVGTLTGSGNANVQTEGNKLNGPKFITFQQVSEYSGTITVKPNAGVAFDPNVVFTGKLILTYENNSAATPVKERGRLKVTGNLTIFSGNLIADGVTIADGVYSGAGLTALGANFVDGGGTLTISNNPYATNPNPTNSQGLATSPTDPLYPGVAIDKVLSWTAPAGSMIDSGYAIQYHLYLDPNQTKVNSSTGCMIDQILTTPSYDPPSDMAFVTQYYWRVDTKLRWVGQTEATEFTGFKWNFKTAAANSAPVANAGNSILTWPAQALSGNVQLAGLVIDLENDATKSWKAYKIQFPGVVPSTEVTFANASSPTSKITITGMGEYILQLTANDGVNPISTSQMKVTVYADACLAAKNNPAGYTKNVYDFDNNCLVDIGDIVAFAGKWLNSNAATTDALFTETIGDPRQGLVAEYWTNITGTDPNSLLNDPRYPASPTGSDFITGTFKQAGRNMENYGQRIRGYIVAPTTGSYIFYISTDDNSRLFLSTDTNPTNAVMIAYSGYTVLDNWTANTTQKSAPQSLTKDQYYYVEVIMKEGTGTDYVSVAWSTDGGTTKTVIPGTALRWYLP